MLKHKKFFSPYHLHDEVATHKTFVSCLLETRILYGEDKEIIIFTLRRICWWNVTDHEVASC